MLQKQGELIIKLSEKLQLQRQLLDPVSKFTQDKTRMTHDCNDFDSC